MAIYRNTPRLQGEGEGEGVGEAASCLLAWADSDGLSSHVAVSVAAVCRGRSGTGLVMCVGLVSSGELPSPPTHNREPYDTLPIGPPTAPGNRVARGGTQGGLNCLTHALPRCLPTPTEEADGNGHGVIAGRGGPLRPPPRASVKLVPLLWTGVRLHPPGRTDENLCRCFGAPA